MLATFRTALIIVSCLCSVPGQVPNPSTTPLPLESRTETQKARDEAETEYFRAQTAKLKEPSAQGLTSNIPAMAAVFAGFVALVSFLFNYSANIKNQRDTQFYEALKRFGDKESARLRSSAAGMLSQIALGRGVLGSRRPYFNTAFDQLMTGQLLEDDPVVLASIESAIARLFRQGKVQPFDRLMNINERLTRDCCSRLAEFFASAGATATKSIPDLLWIQAEHVTGYEVMILRDMVRLEGLASRGQPFGEPYFKAQMPRAVSAFSAVPEDTKPAHRLNSVRALETAAARLATSIRLYGIAVSTQLSRGQSAGTRVPAKKRGSKFYRRTHNSGFLAKPPRKQLRFELYALAHFEGFLAKLSIIGQDLPRLQFADCALQGMKLNTVSSPDASFLSSSLYRANFAASVLTGANFSFANLTGAKLSEVDLQYADLTHAKLGGASLMDTNLSSAKVAFMQIDEKTNLLNVNWWAADFSHSGGVDTKLLEKFWMRYSEHVKEDQDDVHSSVRSFINSKRAIKA